MDTVEEKILFGNLILLCTYIFFKTILPKIEFSGVLLQNLIPAKNFSIIFRVLGFLTLYFSERRILNFPKKVR
jgi:hypothetical protein